jgi:hypothetical protein
MRLEDEKTPKLQNCCPDFATTDDLPPQSATAKTGGNGDENGLCRVRRNNTIINIINNIFK